MAITSNGTRDQPQVASSGNTPDFAADLTSISDFFAPRSLRRFTTVALLLASSGSGTDDYAVATNAPGALFRNTGSGWMMYGVPTFADSAARATALSAPATGWRSRLLDKKADYVYNGSAWVLAGMVATAFTRTAANIATGTTLITLDHTDTPLVGADFTESAGVFTCVTAGTYRVTLSVTFAANSTGLRGAGLTASTGPSRVTIVNAISAALVQTVQVSLLLAFAAAETVTAAGLQSSGGNLSTSAEMLFERIA